MFDQEFRLIHEFIIKKSEKYCKLEKEIRKNGIIRINKPVLDMFAFLCQTIISQQISDDVSKILWKRLCLSIKTERPTIKDFKNLPYLKKKLYELRISNRKISYIERLFHNIKNKNIDYNILKDMKNDSIKNILLKQKGIGPWTTDIFLMFFLERKNIFPLNDLIIQKTIKSICILEKKDIKFEELFSPYLSIFSLHLWKMSKRIV